MSNPEHARPYAAASLRDRSRADVGRRVPRRSEGAREGGGGYRGGPGGNGPSGDGRDFRNRLPHGSWWRRWTWRKAIEVLAGAFVATVALIAAGVLYAYGKTGIPTDVSEAALTQSSTVYFSNGKTPVGTFSTGLNRQLLTSTQISPTLKNAVIAAEDRHFYTEGGISIPGTARALYEDVFGSGGLQGGSTITQQFVRNYYATIGTRQTVSRKIKEVFVAVKLAHQESKDWILTQYLNTVYFGSDAYGASAAAQTYFSKSALKLSVAQSAMLAAMINQPSYLSPDPHAGRRYAALVARWHYVLANMVRDGAITQAQAAAQKFPGIMSGPVDDGWTGYRGYIMQAVQDELENTYGYTREQIDGSGLKIVTTFTESMMNALYRSVAADEHLMQADGQALPWYAHVGAVLEKPGSGAILAMYAGPGYSARDCARINCKWNTALAARNQVGSSFKPYVLAAAVGQGMNVQTSVLDGYGSICSPSDAYPRKLSVTVSGTTCPNTPYGWYNFQSSGESNGPVSVAQASALSLNTAYGDLIHRVGTQNVIDMARKFGVSTARYPAGSSLQAMVGQSGIALGQASLTVEEQATTFATLADHGTYFTPHVIAQISQGTSTVPLKVAHRQVLTPAQAADVDYALSFDTVYGTAYPNAVLNPVRPTIAKTGTTNVAQDAFFIGAVPQYSLAVGMYTNSQNQKPNGQTLNVLPDINGPGGYGGAWPATIWRTYMTSELSRLPIEQLPAPDFTGFARWVQAKALPAPKHGPTAAHSPACRQGSRHRGRRPCGLPSLPSSPAPSPRASCGPSHGRLPCTSPTPPAVSPSPSATAPPVTGPAAGTAGVGAAVPGQAVGEGPAGSARRPGG